MPRFQRARKPEEKEVRRAAILRAAARLAREVGPLELSLNELGRRSGVSKPNIYRYFESREEILVCLFVAELEPMVAFLEQGLGARAEIRAVSQLLTEAFLTRPLLCQLLGMLAAILEHNLSVESITINKLRMAELAERVARSLRRALPWLSEANSNWFVQNIALYVAGMWPSANPAHAAAQALSHPDLAVMRIDAKRDLPQCIEILLAGMRDLDRV